MLLARFFLAPISIAKRQMLTLYGDSLVAVKGNAMAEPPAPTNVLGLTAQIVSAHVSNNPVAADSLPSLIQDVYRTLAGIGREPVQPERPQPAVAIKKSVFADHIVCLED